MLKYFMTPLGKIRSRHETALLPKNQKRISKAIRRARAMGNRFFCPASLHPAHANVLGLFTLDA